MATNQRKYTVEFDINKASLNQLKATLQEIQKLSIGEFRTNSPQGFNSIKEAATELNKIKKVSAEVENALDKAFNPQMGVANLTKFSNEIKKIGVDDITRSWSQLGAVGGSATRSLTAGLVATNTEIKQSHKLLDEMATSFKNTVKWGISSSVFNTMTNSLQASWNYAKNLNKSLTDIRIVSEQSADQMERFALQASKAAKDLGATTLDYTKASLIYYQQGDTPEQVTEKANITVKMANALGTSASEVSEYMTAIWNNFAKGGENLEYYADVLAKLGAATASSAEEISTGLEKFAAVSDTVGLSYEYAAAALTTITATTRQSADVVGTALKTLFSRIQDLELGDTLDDGTTLGKYSEALEKVGISLKGQDGQIRDMDELLSDMGDKWQTLSKNQQLALAQTVAGTRQYTQMVAMMDNWDIMEQNIQMAREATGSLQEQQDKYMESTEAHLNRLTASTERFMDALIDDETINDLIDVLSSTVDVLANFVEGLGGGTKALSMLGAVGVDVFSKKISESLLITIKNMEAAKKQAEDTKKAFENINEGWLDSHDSIAPGLKRSFQSASKSMAPEEQEYVNKMIQKIAEEENKVKTADQNIFQAVNHLKEFGGQIDSETPFDANDIYDLAGHFDTVSKKSQSVRKDLIELKNIFKESFGTDATKSVEDLMQAFEKAKKGVESFKNSYGGAFNQEELAGIETTTQSIEELFSKMQGIDLSQKGILDTEYYKQFDEYVRSSTNSLDTVGRKSEAVFNTLGKNAEEAYNKMSEESKKAIDKMTKQLEAYLTKLQEQKEIDAFIDGLAGIAEILSSIQALGNLDDIWNNENLTGWEKFLQITTNLCVTLPTLIAGIKNVGEGLKYTGQFFKGLLDGMLGLSKQIAQNKMLEESIENVEKEQDQVNAAISTENSTATATKIANDNAIIASNNRVIASNKLRKASEKDSVGENVAEGIAETVTEGVAEVASQGVAKKVMGEVIEEGVEQGAKKAASSGVWATLKTAIGTKLGAGGALSGVAKLGMTIGKFLPVIGGVAAAVGTVAAVVALATKEQREAEAQAKKLAAAVEKTKKAYSEAANEYKKFQSDMSAFQSAADALDKLTRGTLEWKAAMIEVNEQAYALLRTYPELADYMDTSKGYLSFTDEGYEEILSSMAARTTVLLNSYRQAEADKLTFELEQMEKRAAKLVDFNKLHLEGVSSIPVYAQDFIQQSQYAPGTALQREQERRTKIQENALTEDDAKTIVNAFKGNEHLLYETDDNTDEILELLRKNGIDLSNRTRDSQENFVADLKSNADGIANYTMSIDEYTQQIAAYTQALLDRGEKPEEASNYEYTASTKKILSDTQTQYEKDLKKEYSLKKDFTVKGKDMSEKKAASEEIMKDYAEKILGYDWTKKEEFYNSWGTKGFTIGESKDNAEYVTNEVAIKKLAEYYANKDLQEGKLDSKINEESIKNSAKDRDWNNTVYGGQNQALNKAFESGKYGYSGFGWTDKNNNGYPDIEETYLELTEESKKELEQKQKEQAEENRKEINKLNEQYKKARGQKKAAVFAEAVGKGFTWSNTAQSFIVDENINSGRRKQDVELEYKKNLFNKFKTFAESIGFTFDENNTMQGLHIDPEDIDTENGKVNIPEEFSPTDDFSKWMDDLFLGKDVASLYTKGQNEYYYNEFKNFKAQKEKDGTWKNYQYSITGKDMSELAESEFNESEKLSDEERKKNKAIEEERIYQEAIKATAETYEISTEAVKAYHDQLVEDQPILKDNKELLVETANTHFEFSKDLDNLTESIGDNKDMLKKWGKEAGKNPLNELDPKDMETVGKVVESMQQMFGEEVDTDWVQDHIDQILKLAEGDMSVYDNLQKDYVKIKVGNIDLDPSGEVGISQEEEDKAKNKFEAEFDDFLAGIDLENLSIGAEIDMDTAPFLEACGTMVRQGLLTQDQLNNIFGELGFDIEWENKKVPKNNAFEFLEKLGLGKYLGDWAYKTVKVPKLTYKGANKKTYRPSTILDGGGSGSSSSKSEPNKRDKQDDQFDRYHDVNVELKKISNELDKVQNLTDRTTGGDWIENLTQQFELLNDQISMTEEKLKIAKGEMSELQGKLATEGAQFAADGTLLNYRDIYYKALNEYNAAIDHYNSLSTTDAQEAYQDTLDAAADKYSEIMENISRYDEVLTDLIPGLEQEIQESLDKQTEIKIDAFNAEIDIRLDVADAIRDWNTFKTKVIDGIKEDDILGNINARLKDFDTYYNDAATGTIQRLTDQIKDSLEQLDQFESKGQMTIYDKFSKTQLEDLRRYLDEMQAEMESLYDLTEEIRQSYLDMMDKAQEKFEEQLSIYEQISNLIEHDINLIKMLYGENAYEELVEYYNQLHENNLEALDMHRQQAEFWKAEMDSLEEGSEGWEKAKENWMNAVSELTSATEESITTIQERFTNAIEAIFQSLNAEVTGGMGLDYMSKEWELINQNSDQYLDTIDGIYAIQKLQNKYQEAIDNNDNLKAQKELKTIMDDELDALREKDKLTQYDVDRAELRYQIALKQIALEEAQQNKTKMRLRRDSQGNYTYQYTADEEQINTLQSEMSDLYQQLYDLDAGEYKNNLNQLYDVWVAFQEDMKAAEQINDEEEKQARKLMLTEQYGELINSIVEQDEEIKKNLYESTMSGLLDLYNSNEENYENMTDGQKEILDLFLNDQTDLTNEAYNNLFKLYDSSISKFHEMTDAQKAILVEEMLPEWNSTLAEMMNTISGKGGFESVCSEAFIKLEQASEEYRLSLKDIETTSGEVFEEIKKGYDKNTEATKELLEENNKLIQSYVDQLDDVQAVIDKMEGLIAKYAEAEAAAKKYAEAAHNAWVAARTEDANEKQDPVIEDTRKEEQKPQLPQPTPQPSAPAAPSLTVGSTISVKPGTRWYADSYGGGTSGAASGGKIKYINNKGTHPYNINGAGWVRKKDIVGYATGGYTGSWNSTDGRLAFLHQKELVLNAQDTKNMLNAVQIVRTITENLSSNLLNRLSAISANTGNGLLAGTDTLEQVVHIDAQFPNVTNSNEIEDALNNLVNRAAQHITKN